MISASQLHSLRVPVRRVLKSCSRINKLFLWRKNPGVAMKIYKASTKKFMMIFPALKSTIHKAYQRSRMMIIVKILIVLVFCSTRKFRRFQKVAGQVFSHKIRTHGTTHKQWWAMRTFSNFRKRKSVEISGNSQASENFWKFTEICGNFHSRFPQISINFHRFFKKFQISCQKFLNIVKLAKFFCLKSSFGTKHLLSSSLILYSERYRSYFDRVLNIFGFSC